MRFLKTLMLVAVAGLLVVPMALAQNQGTSTSGGWVPRVAVKPDPSKIERRWIKCDRDFRAGCCCVKRVARGIDKREGAH